MYRTRVPRPTVILWLDAYPVCREATERAGLGNRVEPVTLAAAETPGDELLDRIDALLAWRVPPGILARPPRLRWCAVLDVFRKEPLPADHPFWAIPGSPCCRTWAASTLPGTPRWRACSSTTSLVSSPGSPWPRWSIASKGTDPGAR